MRRNAVARYPKNLLLLFVPTILFYWAVGFYPFQFQFPFSFYSNAAARSDTQVLEFPQAGIGLSRTAPNWLETAIQTKSLQIKLDVLAHQNQQFGPARIFSISKDTLERNLTVGQQGSDLIIRLRRPGSSANGTPAFTAAGVFARSGWHHIDLRIIEDWLQLSIDGQQFLDEPLAENPFAIWEADYRLAMGNEFSFDRPWLGRIRQAHVSVPGTSVDYVSSSGNLLFPALYPVPQANLQFNTGIPFSDYEINWKTWQDWLVNFFGFIPFGLLLALTIVSRRPALVAALLSLSLSLSIEVTQFLFVGRVSEIDDLLLNTLGGVMGLLIGCRLRLCQQPQLAFNSADF